MAVHPHLPGFAALKMLGFVPPGDEEEHGDGDNGNDRNWNQWSGGHQALLG